MSRDPRHVSPNELRHIIAHESVHYQHKDYIWSILRMALLTVYWFNPLAWIASSCSKKDAELYCDETVLQQIGSKQRFEYGNLLIKLAAKPMIGGFCYSVVPMSRKGREMERRIKELSCPQKRYKWLILPMVSVAAIWNSHHLQYRYWPSSKKQSNRNIFCSYKRDFSTSICSKFLFA